MFFKDRQDAGRQLCPLLKKYKDKDVVVYALPRGGVTVAAEIAKFLHAPLDLIFAHKIGHPQHQEFSIAAISESGHLKPSEQVPFAHTEWFEEEKVRQIEAIRKKRELYLKGRKAIPVKDKIAILVDDGIATGLTMQAGIEELKDKQPKKIIVAVPVSPQSTAELIKTMVDDFVGIEIEDYNFLGAVGAYFREFNQVEDDEVIKILNSHL